MIRRILSTLTDPITDRLDHVLVQLGDLGTAVAYINDAAADLAAVQKALGRHHAEGRPLPQSVAALVEHDKTNTDNAQDAGALVAKLAAERDQATEAAKAHRRELYALAPLMDRLLAIHKCNDVSTAVQRAETDKSARFAHARELVDVRTALKPWTDGHQNHDNAGTVVSELVAEWQRITQAEDAGNEEVNRLVTKLAAERDCGQEGVCATAPGCARHWQERSRELVADRDKLAQENTRLAGDLTYAQRELRLVTDERKVQARKTPNEAITRLMAVHGYTGGPGGWQREGGPVWPLETAIEGIELAARATEPAPCYRCNASDSERLYFWTCGDCMPEPKAPDLADANANTIAAVDRGLDLRAAGWHCSPDAGWTKGLDGEYMSIADAHAIMLADCLKAANESPCIGEDPDAKAIDLEEAGWTSHAKGWRSPSGAGYYDTADAHAVMLADKAEAKDNRCKVCGWPIKATIDEGCTAESCSYRPEPGSDEHARLLADRAKATPRDTLADPRPGDLYVEISDEGANIDDADIWMAGTIRGLSPADVINHGPGFIRPARPEEAARIRKDNGLDAPIPTTAPKHCGSDECKKTYGPGGEVCACHCRPCVDADDHRIYAHGPNRARGL